MDRMPILKMKKIVHLFGEDDVSDENSESEGIIYFLKEKFLKMILLRLDILQF